jgi:hypothetical protein
MRTLEACQIVAGMTRHADRTLGPRAIGHWLFGLDGRTKSFAGRLRLAGSEAIASDTNNCP